MKIDIDTVSPVQRRIRVELPSEAVDQEFLRVYENLRQRARIRGFRPGRAPLPVLRRVYGDEVRGQVLSRLVEHSLREVVRERGLKVVSSPEVEAETLEEGTGFAFSALVEVKPEIEVKNYLGLEVEKVRLSITDEQVERVLRQLQESHAQLEPVEERDVVERGDFVILDFVGSIHGRPMVDGKAENYLLEVGGGGALPQFEEALIGLKTHREHTISLTYPADYFDAKLAGQSGEFRVVVREIKKKALPALDDEFAKDHGQCASLDELRQKSRARLESELKEIQIRDMKEQILSRLIRGHPFDVPSAMVERRSRHLFERERSRGGARGAEPPTEQMRKDVEAQARRQVQATLLVEKIAALEKIAVPDEDLRERIEAMARSAGEKGPTLRAIYRQDEAREDLRAQMVFDRTLDFLLERAKMKETDPPVDAREKKS